MPTIRTRRVYAAPTEGDGRRVLVDRLWPRGLSREKAALDAWVRSVAPSDALRRWYGHDPARWDEFRRRYFAELEANPEGLAELRAALGRGTATLLFSSREERLNNASALCEFLTGRAGAPRGRGRARRV